MSVGARATFAHSPHKPLPCPPTQIRRITIERSVFLTTSPNQRNFIQRLALTIEGAVILTCDGFKPEAYRELAHTLNGCEEIWIPYYGGIEGVHCIDELRKTQPGVRLVKYYESLASYFVQPWFSKAYAADTKLDQSYCTSDTADEFVGIREIDNRFGRRSDSRALSFEEVYPERAAPPTLALAKGLFIGQPLVEDGLIDNDSYAKSVLELIKSGLVDTYIQHPREELSFAFPVNIVRLEHPLECYRSVVEQIPLYAIFSTASAYFSLFHENVRIIDIPGEKFTISPWAHKVYGWLKEHNPTIEGVPATAP